MKISEILRAKGRAVATIHPSQTVASAVRDMTERAVGALVVTKDGTHLVGIVSERDVVRALSEDRNVVDRSVEDIMTRNVITCRSDDYVTHAMAVMTHRRHRHL